jgi:hypothetical protein
VTKWKCSLCWQNVESEVKPTMIERLCKPCKVRHYTTLVEIYKPTGGFRLDEARLLLKAAKKEAK